VSITIQPAPVHGSPSTFTANVTDPAGVSSVQWSFGDGTTATTNPVNHTYSSAGSVTVSVIVTDNHGNEQLATQSVTVA
jgi:PKD repeat protein